MPSKTPRGGSANKDATGSAPSVSITPSPSVSGGVLGVVGAAWGGLVKEAGLDVNIFEDEDEDDEDDSETEAELRRRLAAKKEKRR